MIHIMLRPRRQVISAMMTKKQRAPRIRKMPLRIVRDNGGVYSWVICILMTREG